MEVEVTAGGGLHDDLEAEAEFDGVHGSDVGVEEGVDFGEEVVVWVGGVEVVWTGSVAGLGEDAGVLGGDEFEVTVDEVSEAGVWGVRSWYGAGEVQETHLFRRTLLFAAICRKPVSTVRNIKGN